MSIEALANMSGINLYRELTKKEQKLFRKFLKRKLSNCGSWSESWFSEARRLNCKARYSSLCEIDRIKFSMLMPVKPSLQAMTMPVRRSLDYQRIARMAIQVEQMPLQYKLIYSTEIDIGDV